MSHIPKRKTEGATLLSKMFPNPADHTARLTKLNYVHPNWWKAYKLSPPKDDYPLRKVTSAVVPADAYIRKVFHAIPMLRKEKYEHFNMDYQPLASRIALTQMRLMREQNMREEDALRKCQNEIFRDELYFFAKSIRDSPGNHFKLTPDEMRTFYIHDLINEGIELKRRMREKPDTKARHDAVAQYLVEPEPVLDDVKAQRKAYRVPYDPHYVPYGVSGEFTSEGTYVRSGDYNVDDVLALRHDGTFQENQRYIPTKVQVPVDQLIDAVDFADTDPGYPDGRRLPPDSFQNDNFWQEDLLLDETGQRHYSKTTGEYFQHTEILRFKAAIQRENQLDDKILELLNREGDAPRASGQAADFPQEE